MLLDEAFVDYLPDASLVSQAATHPGLIVIRSLTKFYGCPALRVGLCVVARPETIREIQSLLPTWPITQLAMDALAEAVADREYAEASIQQNVTERARLSEKLSALGLGVFPSAANFLFLELDAHLPTAAGAAGALDCETSNPDPQLRFLRSALAPGRYVRVAVRSGEDNCRLTQALAEELRRP